jgi:hypothetical protein
MLTALATAGMRQNIMTEYGAQQVSNGRAKMLLQQQISVM